MFLIDTDIIICSLKNNIILGKIRLVKQETTHVNLMQRGGS